jgi:hypothetical protein
MGSGSSSFSACACKTFSSSGIQRLPSGGWTGSLFLSTGDSCTNGFCGSPTGKCMDGVCYDLATVAPYPSFPKFSIVGPVSIPSCAPTTILQNKTIQEINDYVLENHCKCFHVDPESDPPTAYVYKEVPGLSQLLLDPAKKGSLFVVNDAFSSASSATGPCGLSGGGGAFPWKRVVLVALLLLVLGLAFYWWSSA